MPTASQRDAVAKALFVNIYGDSVRDDPGFPIRLWEQMSERSRSPYYRQADVALAAAEETGQI